MRLPFAVSLSTLPLLADVFVALDRGIAGLHGTLRRPRAFCLSVGSTNIFAPRAGVGRRTCPRSLRSLADKMRISFCSRRIADVIADPDVSC
jgi:hypothetical protein